MDRGAKIHYGRPARRLSDQAREPAVREHLAAGLAVRAVGDLMRLVRDPAEVVTADRARRAVLPVHREVVADLGRQATRPAALGLERLVQDRADGREQGLALPSIE